MPFNNMIRCGISHVWSMANFHDLHACFKLIKIFKCSKLMQKNSINALLKATSSVSSSFNYEKSINLTSKSPIRFYWLKSFTLITSDSSSLIICNRPFYLVFQFIIRIHNILSRIIRSCLIISPNKFENLFLTCPTFLK